jgi:hypothetical protein
MLHGFIDGGLIIGIHFAYGQKHSNGVGITTLQN